MPAKLFAALLVAVLLTQLCSPSSADSAANKLWTKVQSAMLSLNSASGTVTLFVEPNHWGPTPVTIRGVFKFQRPNLVREDDWIVDSSNGNSARSSMTRHFISASNGKEFWATTPAGWMLHGKVDSAGHKIGLLNRTGCVVPISSLFFDATAFSEPRTGNSRLSGEDEHWQGAKYQVIYSTLAGSSSEPSSDPAVQFKYYIGTDLLVHRIMVDAGVNRVFDVKIKYSSMNVRFSKSSFAFKPPKWARPAVWRDFAPTARSIDDPTAN